MSSFQPTQNDWAYFHALELHAITDNELDRRLKIAMRKDLRKQGINMNSKGELIKEGMTAWFKKKSSKIENAFWDRTNIDSPINKIEADFWRTRLFAMHYLNAEMFELVCTWQKVLFEDCASSPDSIHYPALQCAAKGGFPKPPLQLAA